MPKLDTEAVDAIAAVDLLGRPRSPEMAPALARGRKALRRADVPLAGSGWCSRAERLISDRLDGELVPPDPERLDVHLRNCPRCVEHERALVRAIDALAERLAAEPEPAEHVSAETPPEPPRLELVEPPPALPAPGETAAVEEEVEPEPVAEPEPEPVAEPEPEPVEAVEPEPGPAAEPEPLPAAELPVPEPSTRITLGDLAWNALLVLAVLLAVAALVVAGVGVAGGSI